ncbi:MAG: hypothetical protein EAZ85_07340 [Bacteroidetes bacterium]|nr:MAG: hypothetical protein EAZ85_07340 [Bacteroidota bacterium]TAG89459.1 MAG: hypothetical protein EAZ20_06410 [Bacteroidota bacterium]
MKKLFLSFLIFNFVYFCFAQKDFHDSLRKGRDYWIELKREEAKQVYNNILKRYPNNIPIFLKTNYYLALLSHGKLKRDSIDISTALQHFNLVFLNRNKLTKKKKNSDIFSGLSYQQMMHNTCAEMGELFALSKNYQKALYFYDLSEYPYTSQNDDSFNANFDRYFASYCIKESKAKCYQSLNKLDSAFISLFPFINKGTHTQKNSNKMLIDLVNYHNYKITKIEIDNMINQASIKYKGKNEEFYTYTIELYKNNLKIIDTFSSELFFVNEDKALEKYRQEIINTDFYKSL